MVGTVSSPPNHAEADPGIAERLEIINFSDAASEWGSVVPIPASEADRMIALAEQRPIARLEDGKQECRGQPEPLGFVHPWR
jgi:hypothetical protein